MDNNKEMIELAVRYSVFKGLFIVAHHAYEEMQNTTDGVLDKGLRDRLNKVAIAMNEVKDYLEPKCIKLAEDLGL